ncbi:MAG: M20 aminoacylase family protein [Syntrophobacteraceae bacterium]
MKHILSTMRKYESRMMEWRHHLHRHPELGFEEIESAKYISGLLQSWGYEVAAGVGKTGVVATLTRGSGKKAIGLRADMDALPVSEQTGGEYCSTVPGKMHACGHDGHTAMLLGAAAYLAENGKFNGNVRLIFQPAEETMGGARAMMEDGLFERFPVDAVFGMHNIPGLTQGKMFFKPGPIMASADSWEITLKGKGGHGASPELSIDPVVAGCATVMALQTIVSRNVSPLQSAVVSVGAFHAGDADNVIPEKAVLRLSIRAITPEVRELVLGKIRRTVASQAESFGVTYNIAERPSCAVLVNDPEQTDRAIQVARSLLGEENVNPDGPFFMGSEDFALMARKRPASYCMIGNGNSAQIHHPEYDFDDRNLIIGAAFWAALTEGCLTMDSSYRAEDQDKQR